MTDDSDGSGVPVDDTVGRRRIRVLVLEDNPTDAEIVIRELRRAGFDPDWKRVATEAEFLSALDIPPDLILSDYAMPQFDGIRAVELLRERGLDTPFILISGTVGEDFAVSAIKRGADDYLLKDRLARLGSAVSQALEAKRLRDESLKAREEALKISELVRARDDFQALSEQLEARVAERTSMLESKIDELCEARLAALNMMEDAVSAAREVEVANRSLEWQIRETRRSDVANRRLATVVEQAAETIVVTEVDGTIVYVNPAFERITGYTSEEVVGQNSRMLKSGKQTAEFYQHLWNTIGAGGVWQGHFVNQRKDGSLYEEEATISPVRDAAGTIINYVAIKRDVTTEIALEEQLRHVQKIEAIGTLAGGVAHDFNNLLQAMISVVQLLKRKSVEPDNVAHLTQLEKTIRRGSSLTQQLLLFARRETSKRATLDLNQILRDLMDFFHRITPANIHLSVVPASAPCWISADRGQIEQVVMNLAVNAIDAMPDGGALSITTGCDDHAAWLKVSDTGTGIPEAIRDRIFEPFFTTKEAGKGTGLGLSVVYGIVAAHAGTIGVDRPEEGGTVFRVELPLQSVGVTPTAPLEEEVRNGSGERVLLVEDDPAAREGLTGLLEILGYAVVAVGSGEEAFGLDGAVPFSVVLTDYMLPGVPGIEVVRGLHKRWPHIKAIMMSGYAPQGAIEAAVAANEIRFLQKPFDMAALARILSDVLHPSSEAGHA